MDSSGFESGQSQDFFLFIPSRPIAVRTQPKSSKCICVILLPEAKRPGCAAVCARFFLVPVPRMGGSLPLLPVCHRRVHRDNIHCS